MTGVVRDQLAEVRERHKEAIAMVAQLQGELARLREAMTHTADGMEAAASVLARGPGFDTGRMWQSATYNTAAAMVRTALAASPVAPTVEPPARDGGEYPCACAALGHNDGLRLRCDCPCHGTGRGGGK